MDRVRIFLKTTLFSADRDPHVPAEVSVIDAEIVDRGSGALTVKTERVFDERGRPLGEPKLTLVIPWGKVDHLLVR